MIDVICLGEALLDLLANQSGVTLEQVTDWTAFEGGAPTNVACGLVKLGTETSLISCLGRDDVGTRLTGLLTEIGVDRSGLQYHPTAPTRQIYVTRDLGGDRTFVGFIDNLSSDEFADTFLAADLIPESLFSQAKFLAIGTISLATPMSYTATYRAIELAHKNRVQVFVDVNWRSMFWADVDRAKVTILELLRQADFIKMADEEAQWLFDSIDPQLIRHRLPNSQGIFVTAGSKGCHYSLNHLDGFVPAFAVDSMDTTGAGDSFVAALIHQLCQQDVNLIQDADVVATIVRYAAAAGAITTMQPGAIDAQPTSDRVMEFLRICGW